MDNFNPENFFNNYDPCEIYPSINFLKSHRFLPATHNLLTSSVYLTPFQNIQNSSLGEIINVFQNNPLSIPVFPSIEPKMLNHSLSWLDLQNLPFPIVPTTSTISQLFEKSKSLPSVKNDDITCTFCQKKFKTKFDLKRHIRVHTGTFFFDLGEKPFACSFQGCGKHFSTTNILKIHMRKHTGERPYLCNHCSKSFVNSTKLKNHIRTHTGERPYVCKFPGCEKRFTEYSSLSKHKAVHNSKKILEFSGNQLPKLNPINLTLSSMNSIDLESLQPNPNQLIPPSQNSDIENFILDSTKFFS